MAQYNRNNWHHIPGLGGIMATGVSKYTATLRQIPTTPEKAEEFKDEILRIKHEIAAGQFVYKGIKENIQKMDVYLLG